MIHDFRRLRKTFFIIFPIQHQTSLLFSLFMPAKISSCQQNFTLVQVFYRSPPVSALVLSFSGSPLCSTLMLSFGGSPPVSALVLSFSGSPLCSTLVLSFGGSPLCSTLVLFFGGTSMSAAVPDRIIKTRIRSQKCIDKADAFYCVHRKIGSVTFSMQLQGKRSTRGHVKRDRLVPEFVRSFM